MRIGVDARELSGQPTGVGRYLASLLEQWRAMPQARAHEWLLYVPTDDTRGCEQTTTAGNQRPAPGEADSGFAWRQVPGHPGTWWEQHALAGAIRRDRPDVLFSPGYSAPLAVRVPIVLAVHDVSFCAHPEWFGRREGFRRRLLTRRAARKARMVVTISEFSKREIGRHLAIPDERVCVIYCGAMPPQSPVRSGPRSPTVLFVGSIFNRRRVPDLVRAFAAVVPHVAGARLEIVGDNRTHPREDIAAIAASLGIGDRVNLRSYVSDAELLALYRGASAFAFLSEYEGFGLTPLEALAHLVPIVVLDTPVAREVYQDAAIYVTRGDIAGTSDAVRRLLQDAQTRARLLENGHRLLGRYSWPDAARKTLAVLEQAAGK